MLIFSGLVIASVGVSFSLLRDVQPEVAVSRFDIGTVRGGAKIRHAFNDRNESASSAEIGLLASDCSCTVVSGFPLNVLPGARFEVPVEISVSNEVGVREWAIVLKSKSAGTESVKKYVVSGNVIQTAPVSLDFGKQKRGDNAQIRFQVRSGPGHALKIEQVFMDSSYFSVSTFYDSQEPNAALLTLKLNASVPYGGFSKYVKITTSDPEVPGITIPVSGYVLKPLEIGKSVNFGIVKDVSVWRDLSILCPYLDTFEIEDVVSDPVNSVTVDPNTFVHAARDGVLKLRCHANGPLGTNQGSITVKAKSNNVIYTETVPFTYLRVSE